MLFIGDGCNMHIDSNILENLNTNIFKNNDYLTRCMDSYLISKKCCIKLLEYLKNITNKIELPIDHWLNIYLKNNNANIYWAEPTIVTQGTSNGLFYSSIKFRN
jgi:hypothetical protein